jgi:RNA polymerase sigma factor (sigma-70 family)
MSTSADGGRLPDVNAMPGTIAADIADPGAKPYSFEQFYRAKVGTAVRLAALLGADDPEDVAQESMARVEPHLERLPDDVARTAYLRRAVVNLARDRWRHQQRGAARHVFDAATVAGAEELAVVSEDRREVLAGLSRLAVRQREALVLKYWQELSEAEIARAMGVGPGTVKVHLFRGTRALARYLKELQ